MAPYEAAYQASMHAKTLKIASVAAAQAKSKGEAMLKDAMKEASRESLAQKGLDPDAATPPSEISRSRS